MPTATGYTRAALTSTSRAIRCSVGEELREPGSGRSLGVSGVYLGEAILERDEDPATFVLANTIAPVRAGDRLLEIEEDTEALQLRAASGTAGYARHHYCPLEYRCNPDHAVQQCDH
jgi:hypothetical protein